MDLSAAAELVAKAANGTTTGLQKLGIAAQDAKGHAKDFGSVLDAMSDTVGGQAAASVKTYAGRLDELANAWDDVLEGLGRAIISNQTVIDAIGAVIDLVRSLTTELATNKTAMRAISNVVILAAKSVVLLIDGLGLLITAWQKTAEAEARVAMGLANATDGVILYTEALAAMGNDAAQKGLPILEGLRDRLMQFAAAAAMSARVAESVGDATAGFAERARVLAEQLALTRGQVNALAKDHDTHATRVREGTAALTDAQKALETYEHSVSKLAAELLLAAQADAPLSAMVDHFGKAAVALVEQAQLIPGAFANLPESIKEVASAQGLKDLQAVLDDLHAQTVDLAHAWSEDVAKGIAKVTQAVNADLIASFQNVTRMQRELSINALSGSERRLAQIDAEEDAAIAAAEARLTAGSELSDQELALIRATFDQKRAMERRYTGDVVKDAELRGFKTRAELEQTAATEQQFLEDMKAARGLFTAGEIAAQQKIADAAKVAAGHVTADWNASLDAVAHTFDELAKIAGDDVGKILTDLADLITLSQQAGDAAVVMSAGFGQMGEALGRISQGVGSLGQNLGNLVAGAAQVADGAVTAFGVMEKATDKASKGMRVAGGALAGAKIGAQFGGAWGAAAGAAIGAIVGFLRKPGFADVMKRVGNEWGVEIGEELARAIADTAKKEFKGDRLAAEIFSMKQIIEAAGGVTEKNVDKMLGKLRAVFSMVETGKFTTAQATKVLDENFGTFADHVLKSGQIASKGFTEILELNKRFGTQSTAIMEFVTSQTTRLGTALEVADGAAGEGHRRLHAGAGGGDKGGGGPREGDGPREAKAITDHAAGAQ